jgi:hypothetical protein
MVMNIKFRSKKKKKKIIKKRKNINSFLFAFLCVKQMRGQGNYTFDAGQKGQNDQRTTGSVVPRAGKDTLKTSFQRFQCQTIDAFADF